ncbi:branched-chain amino acid ABC transporter permease [Candidatus Peregrinibacteria bacterium]|nr:branched-chain amino acid ABC transporter permease [Candidatus Peregrinibacteria bacterium]
MSFFLHLITITAMSLPSILGFNLVFGKGKIFHFGPIGVSLVSAYATFLTLGYTESYPLAIGAGLMGALLAALLLNWLALQLEPDGLAIMSIAVHLAVLAVVLNGTELTRGALGIPRIPRITAIETPVAFAIAAITVAVLWIAFLSLLHRSSFGRKLAALAEHPWHAAALGINRARIHGAAFLLSAIGATLTSLLYPQYLHLLHPNDYAFSSLIFLVMIIVAGRPGSVRGVVLSATFLTFLKEALRFLPLPLGLLGPLRLLLFGMILLIAVWLRRDSLFPKQRTI